MVGGALGISAASTAVDVAAEMDSVLTPHALQNATTNSGKKNLTRSRNPRCMSESSHAPLPEARNLGLPPKVYQYKWAKSAPTL